MTQTSVHREHFPNTLLYAWIKVRPASRRLNSGIKSSNRQKTYKTSLRGNFASEYYDEKRLSAPFLCQDEEAVLGGQLTCPNLTDGS